MIGTLFSKSEIKAKYSIGEVIGTGNFAEVRECVCKEDKKKYAVKISEIKEKEDYSLLKQEIDILGRLDHPNIVKLHEIYESAPSKVRKKKVYMVMELVTGGELFDRIVEQKTFTESEARDITRTMIEALAYMHAHDVVHRDLKPENILLEHSGPGAKIKIADFGLSKLYNPDADEHLKTMCGTPGYVAPEILRNRGYGPEVDMWSVGVLLYVLLVGFPPFYEEDQTDLFRAIIKGKYDFPSPYWDTVSADAIDFVKGLLKVRPEERLTPKMALEHKWMVMHQKHMSMQGIDLGTLRAYQEMKKAKRRWREITTTMTAASKFHMALKGAAPGPRQLGKENTPAIAQAS